MSNSRYLSILNEIKKKGGSVDFQNTNKKVLIVDGLNTFIRVFSVMPTLNENGVHVGGIVGFLKSVGFAINMFNPTRTIIVFDGKGGSNRRRKLYSDYKNKRRTSYRVNRVAGLENVEDERRNMLMQLRRVADYLELLPLTTISVDGIEADDAIATAVSKFKNKVERIIIGSPDKDLAQCVEGEKVVMWSTRNKEYTNEQGVRDKFGVNPNQIPDYLALAGDVSDGIPGIKGVGPKTASFLISKYGDIHSIYKNSSDWEGEVRGGKKIRELLNSNFNEIILFKDLATLRTDVPLSSNINELKPKTIDRVKINKLSKELGFENFTY